MEILICLQLGFVQAGMMEGKRGQGVEGICKEVRLKDKISRMRLKRESRQKGQREQKEFKEYVVFSESGEGTDQEWWETGLKRKILSRRETWSDPS